MNVINVSYLYSLPEFYALLRLTGCKSIPFCKYKEVSFSVGLEELKRNMLVTQAGKTVTLDKISAFFAKTVGECTQCVCIRDNEYFSGLFYSSAVSIVLMRQEERWIVTPCQQFDDGLEFLLQRLPTEQRKGEVCVQTGRGAWIRPYPAADAAPDIIRVAAQWTLNNERPYGKDSEIWKP